MARHVEKLHAAREHQHVIALIEAALIHGQSQPWMYEVLALSMELDKRPGAEIDRVVMSLTDFGTANFGTLTFSAAYLVRLGRESAGLRLYREASRMQPEQPEPYLLGLRLARKLQDVEAMAWTACGVLQYGWTPDYRARHREAENVAAEAVARLQKGGDAERVARLQMELAEARRRDLWVRLTWSGAGDLDLFVEEPGLAICSFEQPETAGGGVLLHEGYGPDPANCFEEYVCAQGRSGDYAIRVRLASGEVVGHRATLTIIRHQGTPAESVETRSIAIGQDESIVRIPLENGRRTSARPVMPRETAAGPMSAVKPPAIVVPAPGARRVPLPAKVTQAALEYEQSRAQMEGMQIRRTGAVGFQPMIQIVPDGATFAAQAVVSPDRRYVRIGVSPVFTNLTDVFTHTFVRGR